mgnify:CR=1 FL=1
MNPEAPNKSKGETPMDGSDQVAVRQAKLDQMREHGFDPYRANWEQSHTSLEACGLLPEEEEDTGAPFFFPFIFMKTTANSAEQR